MSTEEKPGEGIYFLSLTLENVRCFGEKQTLDLSDGNGKPARWTVMLGDNGTGKTTLLQAILRSYLAVDYFLDEDEKKIQKASSPREVFSLRRNGSHSMSIEAEFAHGFSFSRGTENLEVSRIEQEFDDFMALESWDDKQLNNKAHATAIFGYDANRTLKSDKTSLEIENIHYNNAFSDKSDLINAEEWLLQTDYVAKIPSQIQEQYQERFKIIIEVLVNLLPGVKAIGISVPTEKHPNPKVGFETDNGWLNLSQLSLGYQTMTAWMVDLAARMFAAYPNSPNPIAEPAVVLIDEIDLHLHPKWQRTIMSYLSERFVNTQFIVTAHSPLIVQAAEQANIVVLRREGDHVVIEQQKHAVQGWRIDQLLTSDLFDLDSARSPHYEKKLAYRRQLLSKPKLTAEDRAQLKALEAEIGYLPTAETAEDIAAMDIIRRAAALLKTSA